MKNVFAKLIIIASVACLFSANARSEDVVFEGVRSLSEVDLAELVGKLPERKLTQADRVQLESEVIKALKQKGIDQPKVFMEKRSDQLLVRVEEGLPTRLNQIQFSLKANSTNLHREDWKRLKARLDSEIDFNRASILDRTRIQDWRRVIESVLITENYIGTATIGIREEVSKSGELPPNHEELESTTARWLDLIFEIDLGQRVTFGFRGNHRLTRNELLGVVEEQKIVGAGTQLARAIQQAIELKYRSLGYFQISVQSRTLENHEKQSRHITFLIQEGPRVEIDQIEFEGNIQFSSKELMNRFYEMAPTLPSRNVYVEKDVELGAESVLDYVRSKGYLSAKLISVNRVFIDEGQKVRIKIYVYEGEQTRLRGIEFRGAKVFQTEEMKKWLGLIEGEPLNLFALTAGIDTLKREYRNQGYLGVRVRNENQASVVQYAQKNQFADVLIDIYEGPQYRVGEISFEGLQRTQRQVVEREITFASGEVLEERKLIETEANLRRLGIFSKITIEHRDDPKDQEKKQIRILFEEVGRIRVAFGVGFRNDLGIRGFAEAAYTNLWERNHTWSLLTNINRRVEDFKFFEYEFTMRYLWPHFLLPRLDFRPEVSFERRQYILFDADTISVRGTFEWPLVSKWNLTGSFTYALERTQQFNSQFEADNRTLRIGSITPAVRFDMRDNPLVPTRGVFSLASLELALPETGSQSEPVPVGYTRFQFRLDGFVPFTRSLIWFLSFRTGFERNLINPSDYPASSSSQIGIPLSKQFALGGAGSLRGFKLQEINVQNLTIQGTLSYVNIRTQIDFPFTDSLKIGPFLDGGALHVDRYLIGNLRYSFGFGIHYSTPVGPVNFDWGFKVDPAPGEDTERFHFTIGVL